MLSQEFRDIVESVAYGNKAARPYGHWGFHDDHRESDHPDRYANYRPALQQVKAEYLDLLAVLEERGCVAGRALQLGIGMTDHSHDILKRIFRGGCVSIDIRGMIAATGSIYPGARTDDRRAIDFARELGPYSFILVDAGHELDDVEGDYLRYWEFLAPDGIMAFHDALDRDGYPEIGVPRFIRSLKHDREVNIIGEEVGFAWIRKPL